MLVNKNQGLLLSFYFFILLLLFIYSFTQIDLNLTLSSNPAYQNLQNRLIEMGYYHRGLSTLIYLLILSGLFLCQALILRAVKKGSLGKKGLWVLIFTTSLILLFAYPAFSHDIFNYIFDARIQVFHRQSPWQFTALDFPQDEWTRFMHWTHRTYPYGPLWLPLTLPFYLLGLGKFTLTLFWFKTLAVLGYLTSAFLISRLVQGKTQKQQLFCLAAFAFNPLIIIESLVSAHLDIIMAAFLLAAVYFYFKKSGFPASLLFLIFSLAIKYLTAVALPLFLFYQKQKKDFLKFIYILVSGLSVVTLAIMIFREPLPWYLITPIAVTAFLASKQKILVFSLAVSLGMLLRYAPFIYTGDYSQPVKLARNILTLIPLLPALIYAFTGKKKELSFSGS